MEAYGLVAVAVAVCAAVWYVVAMRGKRRRGRLPPGPFPWPIVGNIPAIGTYPHQTYVEMAKRYGDIFTLYLGSARVVVVTSAAMAKEVLVVQDARFAHRPVHDLMYTCWKHMNPGGNSSFSLAYWTAKVREMRQICDRHFMLPRRVEATRSSRREEVCRTVALVEARKRAGEPVDLRHYCEELAFRLSCRATFNKAFVGSEASGDSTLSPELFWTLGKKHSKLLVEQNPSDVIPLLKPLGDVFGVNKKWRDIYGPFLQCSDKLQAWYRKHTPNADQEEELDLDYLQMLMRKALEGSVPESAINEQTIEVLVAGADTVAVSLEWAMLELVRHPDMMEKLRVEIDGKFGGDSPVEEEALVEMPYLDAVVKETLRLHHPAPVAVPHYNTEDTEIGGYLIPAGTSIITNLYAIQRNPDDWGRDALEFNPERFFKKDANVMGSSDLQYIPFGAGRRICPGRLIAVRGIALAVAALVHAFEWEAVPGYELSVAEAAGGLNCRPINALVLRALSRPQVSLYH